MSGDDDERRVLGAVYAALLASPTLRAGKRHVATIAAVRELLSDLDPAVVDASLVRLELRGEVELHPLGPDLRASPPLGLGIASPRHDAPAFFVSAAVPRWPPESSAH